MTRANERSLRGELRTLHLLSWHFDELGFDFHPRPDLLKAVDNDLLAGLQAVSDLAQAVMKRSQPDGTRDNLVLLVDDIKNLLALVVIKGALADP